jgi:hypothetical protein
MTRMRGWWVPYLVFFKYGFKYIVVAIIGYGGVFARRWRHKGKQNKAAGWPSVEGVIVSSKAEHIPKTHLYLATLTYSYFVEEYRAGKYTREFSNESDADEFARSMKDRRLQIRYQQSKPDISVIDQSALEQLSPLMLRR